MKKSNSQTVSGNGSGKFPSPLGEVDEKARKEKKAFKRLAKVSIPVRGSR